MRYPCDLPTRESRTTCHLKFRSAPPQIAIHHDQTVLISEENGAIGWPSEKGLYFRDTRLDQRLEYLHERNAVDAPQWGAPSPITPRGYF